MAPLHLGLTTVSPRHHAAHNGSSKLSLLAFVKDICVVLD
jgi:hypothetical protein